MLACGFSNGVRKRTVGHTGTNASGETDLCLGEAIPPSKPTRGKRKAK
jgi:putative transposase